MNFPTHLDSNRYTDMSVLGAVHGKEKATRIKDEFAMKECPAYINVRDTNASGQNVM